MTFEEAQQVRNLTEDQKKLLQDIATAAKRFDRELKDFKATNETELKDELNAIIEKKKARQTKQKEKQDTKKQCIDLIKQLAEGQNALIGYSQLYERLESIKEQIQKENKQKQVQRLLEQSGLTRNELVEYLNDN